MPITQSPLRYPGGKSSLSSFLAQVIQLNGVGGGTYVEPYAGGAGAALELLFQNVVERIVVNDFDPSIYAFWYSALNFTETFIERIKNVPLTIEEWTKQKEILNRINAYTTFDVGFAAFYLNRCNRSGILMAGPIGGKHQSGKYTLGVRFNRDALAEKIEKIARHKDKINLYNLDAIELLQTIVPTIRGPKLIYLDPPYYEKGELLYLNAYEHEDHLNLAWILSKAQPTDKWVLTYDDAEAIKEMYKGSITTLYSLNYCVHHAKKGSELLIAPHNLLMPPHINVTYGRKAAIPPE